MFKKIIGGFLATSIMFSGGQAFAAPAKDFKLDKDNIGVFESEEEANNMHKYTFTVTEKQQNMKLDFEDLSKDGDAFKVTLRKDGKVVFSDLADLKGKPFTAEKGSYEISVGQTTYKDGGKYKLRVYKV